jgi:hypothetical protein
MSVTNYDEPQDYTPAFNKQIFTALSTQVATANFKYTVVCTDMLTSATATYQADEFPNDRLAFDSKEFVINYIKHYIPNNTYGWEVCTNALREYKVNIGETYGTTPAYASGTDVLFKAWNSGLPYIEFNGYNDANYIYDSSTSSPKYLSSRPSEGTFAIASGKTYSDRSLYLYFIANTSDSFASLTVKSYSEDGTLIGTSYIANPYYNSANYYEKYNVIGVGKKDLDNIASGDVTGTYPVLPANCAYYELYDVTTMGSPPASVETPIRRIYIECEPRYIVYTLHYIDKGGNAETLNFAKVSEETVNAEKVYYRKNPYEWSGNSYIYSIANAQERVLSSSATTRIKLNSDWMSEEECESHKYLISSPLVMLDLGSSTSNVPVKVMTTSWRVNKKWNERLYNVTIDIEYTFKDVYQHGC